VDVAHEARIGKRNLGCAKQERRRQALVAVSARHLSVATQDLGRLIARGEREVRFLHGVRVGVEREVERHVLVVERDGRSGRTQRCDPRQRAQPLELAHPRALGGALQVAVDAHERVVLQVRERIVELAGQVLVAVGAVESLAEHGLAAREDEHVAVSRESEARPAHAVELGAAQLACALEVFDPPEHLSQRVLVRGAERDDQPGQELVSESSGIGDADGELVPEQRLQIVLVGQVERLRPSAQKVLDALLVLAADEPVEVAELVTVDVRRDDGGDGRVGREVRQDLQLLAAADGAVATPAAGGEQRDDQERRDGTHERSTSPCGRLRTLTA
jgi:hypothetical protein